MKKLITAVIGGTAVATMAFASASVLQVNGNTIQAGVDSDLRCDTDGVDVNWGLETSDNSVRSVTITGIDAACDGATMFIQTNLMGDNADVELDGSGEAKVSFPAPYPTPQDINKLSVWIEG